MGGHSEVQYASPLVCQHQEDIKDLEPDRRYGEEVNGNHTLHVVLQESPPGLGRRSPAADHVLAHAGLADVDAKLEQFTVNPRGTPERIVAAHRTNQGADFLWHRRSSRLAAPNFPSPKQAKALSMPAYDGRRFDEEDICPPIVPDDAQRGPQKSIRRGELGPLHGAVKNAELMAERQDFKLQSCAAPQ
jgi:hypothetical protein